MSSGLLRNLRQSNVRRGNVRQRTDDEMRGS